MFLHDYLPALKYGATILNSEVSGGGILTYGNIYFVDAANGNDNNDGLSYTNALATISAAFAKCTTNNNDVILLAANGTPFYLTGMFTVDKNKVHFVGLDGGGRKMGARCRVVSSGVGTAADVSLWKVTGNGCSFRNIKFDQGSFTNAASLYCVSDLGQNTYWENCDIELTCTTQAALATTASLDYCGSEGIYVNCTIGVHSVLYTYAANQQMFLGNQHNCGSGLFDHCRFQSWTSSTTAAFIRYGAIGINSSVLDFEDCIFQNRGTIATSGVQLACAIVTSASPIGGRILVSYPRIDGATDLATTAGGGAVGVFVTSPTTSTSASDCVAIQAS